MPTPDPGLTTEKKQFCLVDILAKKTTSKFSSVVQRDNGPWLPEYVFRALASR